VAILPVSAWVERERNINEEYAVYSAYFSESVLNDTHEWSVSRPVQVVIEDKTNVGENLRLRVLYALDSRVHFDQLHASTRASFFVRNLLRTQILPRFDLPSWATVILASKPDVQSPEFQMRIPHYVGYFALSGVGFNLSRTQAVFYIDYFCGLCGGGAYVLMEKSGGSWHVRDRQYTWIS
jgi:hypothetical protein